MIPPCPLSLSALRIIARVLPLMNGYEAEASAQSQVIADYTILVINLDACSQHTCRMSAVLDPFVHFLDDRVGRCACDWGELGLIFRASVVRWSPQRLKDVTENEIQWNLDEWDEESVVDWCY